jgi:hypothetical protein
VAGKLRRMLERKIDLWDPEEVFELMPVLMKASGGDLLLLLAIEVLDQTDAWAF